MRYGFAFVLGALLVAGCAQNKPANTANDDDATLNQAVQSGGYVPPANRGGYLDATDPNAYPPTPEQPSWGE